MCIFFRFIIVVLTIIFLPTFNTYASFTDSINSAVELNVNVLLVDSNGNYLDGDDYDVQVMLGVDDVIYWNKLYEGASISNGLLELSLSGNDDEDPQAMLIAKMFDEENVELSISVDDETVSLHLMTVPYSIKSRISDYAHNSEGIQNIPVMDIATTNIDDLSMLIIENGEWVPTKSVNEVLSGLDSQQYKKHLNIQVEID